ncbi:MAG: M20/M25/M40 family metallo-hydrolase [Planctomycetota bacterium]|nr:MAG: M20/M25/M40 family metallo-hydrolase [Planctomycetota bacterium]
MFPFRAYWFLMLCGAVLAPSSAELLSGDEPAVAAKARLERDLSYLASDQLQGRDVGSEGIEAAAKYIAEQFAAAGLKTDSFDGTPFQEFTIPGPRVPADAEHNRLQIQTPQGNIAGRLGEDFQPLSLGSNGAFAGPAVFAGYGITAPDIGYDDYAGIDVTGKVVIVLRKEPQQDQADSPFAGTESSPHAYFTAKEANAAVHNAAALILVNDSQTVAQGGDVLLGTEDAGGTRGKKIPTIFCSRSLIEPVLQAAMGQSLEEIERAIDADLKPRSRELQGVSIEGEVRLEASQIPAKNVIGVLPGSGALADQYVIVGAHYDHVGMGGRGSLAPGTIAIHNGADDNGSGTTALMEVARRLAATPAENRRTILFMAFSAEEKGLLGSKYYVRNPRWPLEQTVAMVNMDMVGRLGDGSLTVFGTGTAVGFDTLVDRLNQATGLPLAKQEAGKGPSDHASFYEAGIPVFHFFTGLHNDYHRPSDDVEKVDFDGMGRIVDLVTAVVEDLATRPERPRYLKTNAVADVGRERARAAASRRAVLGIQLDRNADRAVISALASPEAPAARAGLVVGDAITAVGGQAVGSIEDLLRILTGKRPGDEVIITVERDGQKMQFKVQLGEG